MSVDNYLGNEPDKIDVRVKMRLTTVTIDCLKQAAAKREMTVDDYVAGLVIKGVKGDPVLKETQGKIPAEKSAAKVA